MELSRERIALIELVLFHYIAKVAFLKNPYLLFDKTNPKNRKITGWEAAI